MGVAAVELRVVKGSLEDAAFQVVRHDQAWATAEVLEHADMRPNPVGQCLGPGRLGVGVVGGAQHGDEELGGPHGAGGGIADGQRLAGVVDEDLVAGQVGLTHAGGEPRLELSVQFDLTSQGRNEDEQPRFWDVDQFT